MAHSYASLFGIATGSRFFWRDSRLWPHPVDYRYACDRRDLYRHRAAAACEVSLSSGRLFARWLSFS
jgi:hypothetical protein